MHVLSCVQLFLILWTVTPQVPLSMRFFRQEYWSGLPFLYPGNLPDPGIEPVSPEPVSCIAGGFFTTESPGKPWAYRNQQTSIIMLEQLGLQLSLMILTRACFFKVLYKLSQAIFLFILLWFLISVALLFNTINTLSCFKQHVKMDKLYLD